MARPCLGSSDARPELAGQTNAGTLSLHQVCIAPILLCYFLSLILGRLKVRFSILFSDIMVLGLLCVSPRGAIGDAGHIAASAGIRVAVLAIGLRDTILLNSNRSLTDLQVVRVE